jgi:hypothetical protein
MKKTYLRKLASEGYSIIPVEEDKRPKGAWKKYQKEHRSPDEVEVLDSPLYGLICGYNDVECIDVDLKVIVGLKEQKEWWAEFLQFLEDNIEDFMSKVTIVKTKNAGFHILYRCFDVAGNTKIATLKGQSEAIIETRGVGGMVVLYDNYLSKRRYHDMQYITPEEREIIWEISRTYHYTGDMPTEEPKSGSFQIEGISPWADYNSQYSALDLISSDFDITRRTNSAYIIRRHGAKSPHSGYVYQDSGCMYLFSTGTIYPAEQLLSPFAIYAYKYHNGDMTAAGKDLYEQGYGSRAMPKVDVPKVVMPKEEKITRQQFPIKIFPEKVQSYMLQSANTLGLSIDYMGSSFLWVLSVIIGNSLRMQVKQGWYEVASLWIAVVGKPGIGKTPSINQIIFPLREMNIREQKEYARKYAKYREYEAMDKKQKEYAEYVEKPVSKQFLVGDITLEALIDLHEQNPNSVGVFKDELAGWFKDMNKYRQGSDLEFWLSSWSGTSISLNRKTSKSAFVDKPMIPVLGGIQPSVFDEFTTGENKENGFVDRILISYPELRVNHYNANSMDNVMSEMWIGILHQIKYRIDSAYFKMTEKGDILTMDVTFSDDANQEWIRIHDKLTDIQNSDDENEYMKSMLPKQKSYIPRFALLLNTLWSILEKGSQIEHVSKENILRAELLSEYFINMSKLVKQDVKEKNELMQAGKTAGSDKYAMLKAMFKANPELNKTTASEVLGVSRKTVYNMLKQIENEQANKRKAKAAGAAGAAN